MQAEGAHVEGVDDEALDLREEEWVPACSL
jgi:hypothetical protein